MDEYQIEISQIQRHLAQLRAAEAAPAIIDEFEAQHRNLKELYEAATATLECRDPRARQALALLGYGPWTLANVYGFVYDAAMEAEADGRDLANAIRHTDYAASLVAALEAGE